MKSQSKQSKPDWTHRLGRAAAVRRTIEKAIRQAWGCDQQTAAREFDRALQAGELEQVKIGLSGGVTAYKLKDV